MLNLIPPKSGKLRPIQLKKSIKGSSSKIAIDCETIKYKVEYPGIYDFLHQLDLAKYLDTFIQYGIDNNDKLNYLNDEHLKLIKLPYVHRVKILQKVNELKCKLSNCKSNQRELTHSDYEELICEPDSDYISNKQEQRRTFTDAILSFKRENEMPSPSLTPSDMIQENSIKILNKKTSSNTEEKAAKDQRYKIDEDIQANFDKEEPEIIVKKGEYTEEANNKNSSNTALPLNQKKLYCYHCLHIIKDKCIAKYKKTFCSIHCLDKYEEKSITKCSQCLKKCLIVECVKVKDKQYCSLECFNKGNPGVNESTNIDINQNNSLIHKKSLSSEEDELIIDILS